MDEQNTTNVDQIPIQEIEHVDYTILQEQCDDERVVKFIRNYFRNEINTELAIKLAKDIVIGRIHIDVKNYTQKYKRLVLHNYAKFDDTFLKLENIKELNTKLIELTKQIIEDIDVLPKENIDKNDENVYIIKDHNTYNRYIELVCKEGGTSRMTYSFVDSRLNVTNPSLQTNSLQRCKIIITEPPIKFNYPILFSYVCPQCSTEIRLTRYNKYPFEVESTKAKYKCTNFISYVNSIGETKSQMCKTQLLPHEKHSKYITAYYYNIQYLDNENKPQNAKAISLNKYNPGVQENVLFKVNNESDEIYMLIDENKTKYKNFELPKQIPEENYVFTLIKDIDQYIKHQTKLKLHGLYPIKVALLLQLLNSKLDLKRVLNIQIIGDPGTGKTTLFTYYGYLLYNTSFLSSMGLNISVARLRGTKSTLNIFGKEIKIIGSGYLGSHDLIHIDESRQNKELVEHLKGFLLDDNYSYNKADTNSNVYKRIAHINLSENLDNEHVGMYRGSVKKYYKEYQKEINGVQKPEWNEDWDLYMPLYHYNENPYLKKAIHEKRKELEKKQVFWIDGYDIGLHERFVFYFYLVNENKETDFNKIANENINKKIVSEAYKLMEAFRGFNIDVLMDEIKPFVGFESDQVAVNKRIMEIIKQYEVNDSIRFRKLCFNIVDNSRILNKRKEISEQDYELLKYIIENTHRKLDVSDTTVMEVKAEIKQENKYNIEFNETDVNDSFKLPDNEF